MALFKIARGPSNALGTLPTQATEGFAYFQPYDGSFYIDIATANQAVTGYSTEDDATANRIKIAAGIADKVGHSLTVNGKTFNGSTDIDVGTIAVNKGGTGKTSWTQYGVLYASAKTTLAQVTAAAGGAILVTGNSKAPTWLAAGNAGDILKSNSTTGAPEWIDPTTSLTAYNTSKTLYFYAADASGADAPTGTNSVSFNGSADKSISTKTINALNKAGGTMTGTVYFASGMAYYIDNAGCAKFNSLDTTGATNLGSTLGVTGATTLSSTLAVTGATTLSSTLAVTGIATMYHVIPADDNTTYELGSETARWKKLHIGTADTYGSATQPIWWSDGKPATCTSYANAAVKTAGTFTSAKSVTLTGDATGTASSKAGWSVPTTVWKMTPHEHDATYVAATTAPTDYDGKLIFTGMKTNATIGITSELTYSYVIGLRGYSSKDGGGSHEFAFNDNAIYHRMSSTGADTWGSWNMLVRSAAGSAVGSATQPVWINSAGIITACTSYANASVNYANSAGAVVWANVSDKPATATRWPKWSEVTDKTTFSGGTTTLAWGQTHTIATVDGNAVKITMPANPNTDHYAWADITGKPATATSWPTWDQVTGKPSTFTPSAHTHAYLPFELVSSLDANSANSSTKFWVCAASITNAAFTNHSVLLNVAGLGTPFQLQIPDSSHLYIYKRWYSSSAWSAWSKISAGYADSAGSATMLSHKSLKNTVVNSESGSFAFSGSGAPWEGTDWVGLQIGDSVDKFQFSANNNTLVFRQNDNGGANTSWSDWVTMITSANYTSYTVTKTGGGASGTWGISISGNAATATKATQDGSGNTITSYYCTLSTAQTISGTKTFTGNINIGSGGAGGVISGSATNGGINSIRIGDDVWLGDCNQGGIMGMKSTGSNCGFWFYNSGATNIGQLYADGTYIVINKPLRITAESGIYYTGSNSTNQMIRFINNTSDSYGNGIAIGGGGQTIIGGGESASAMVGQAGNAGAEIMYVGNDADVYIFSNLQDGWGSRKAWCFDTGGTFWANGCIDIRGATNATMSYSTTNPRIRFSENGTQAVYIVYCDWDSYRASKGIKVGDADNSDPGNVWFEAQGHIYAAAVHSAVWNDYAECRKSNITEPGRVIVPDDSGMSFKTTERLMAGCRIISDTWGMLIGESEEAKTPVAICGRVLAYPYQAIENYHAGDCVCSAPNGTVDIMTREEIKEWPDRIIGVVNEIPNYEIWTQTEPDGEKRTKQIIVNGRIWIDVR